jgi:hypothetical protein
MTDSDRKRGGQTIGDKPMTQAEYDLRYRLAHPDKYKEVHKYKPKTKELHQENNKGKRND